MDVQTVTMEPDVAATAFKEYRAAFMAQRNQIDGELMRGYKALAEGKTLIGLTEAIQAGGVDDLGRPRLAIARADEAEIEMRIDAEGALSYRPRNGSRAAERRFEFPDDTLPRPAILNPGRIWSEAWFGNWIAVLPFIPPKFRPPLKIENYHLLWEAEWRRGRGAQRRDPMLLRRVGGDLFAVVAAWDLTEVEKLVLAR